MRNRAGLETRERILDATRRLLADRGLDGTTVKAICDSAGIRAGSFYNLFASKEEVVLTVVREAITAVDPDPAGTGTDHLEDLVEAYVRFVRNEPTLARVYFIVALSGGLADGKIAARMLRHHEARVERFTAAFRRARPDLDPDRAAETMESLIAALNGFALHTLIDPTFDFAGHAKRLLHMEPAP